jgi:hypothetical protein
MMLLLELKWNVTMGLLTQALLENKKQTGRAG